MSKFLKLVGSRILSEANDLKRTITSMSQELGIEESMLQSVVNGDASYEDVLHTIGMMEKIYPIDASDILLIEDDCFEGVKIMRSKQSTETSRIFNRLDRHGSTDRPYYEYRDTAMSKLAPFKPEWIKELRVVENSDPENPDVVYNNGHFMHQITFFIGPVNFYWEVNGEKFCEEMNTGDSCYITPYWKHSFTSRDKSKTALILAITFGGDVRRSQKELYAYGSRIKNFVVNSRNSNSATSELLNFHMQNENLSIENVSTLAQKKKINIDINKLLDPSTEKLHHEKEEIASLLNISISDLEITSYLSDEEVVVTHRSNCQEYKYPSDSNQQYKIRSLARTKKMPLLKSFDISVLMDNNDISSGFYSGLHTYIYNYGESDILVRWVSESTEFEDYLNPNDSMYIQPFIQYSFSKMSGEANIFCARTCGAINISTMKELSYFSDVERVYQENSCWFNNEK